MKEEGNSIHYLPEPNYRSRRIMEFLEINRFQLVCEDNLFSVRIYFPEHGGYIFAADMLFKDIVEIIRREENPLFDKGRLDIKQSTLLVSGSRYAYDDFIHFIVPLGFFIYPSVMCRLKR